jgi:RNA polymerase sigma-70 factor, ECF subfamily
MATPTAARDELETERHDQDNEDDASLVRALRHGDTTALSAVVERYHTSLVRLAMSFVRDRAIAEEVAQETWQAVLQERAQFQGRSSLRSWIFRILANRARSRATRERRHVPFSALATGGDSDAPATGAERFAEAGTWPGRWASLTTCAQDAPEEQAVARETRACLRAAIASLPPRQYEVIVLRDVQGFSAAEARRVLHLSDGHQRVLLHRARSRLRRHLAPYLDRAGNDRPPLTRQPVRRRPV